MLHVASVCTSCWMLLRVVAQSLKPVKLFSQRLPTFLFFRDRRNVAQQCWIRLHNSSNIVGATHAHYTWITKTHGLYPSHDALQVPTLLGVVASVCRHARNNMHATTPNIVGATMLGVVASVSTQPYDFLPFWLQSLPTMIIFRSTCFEHVSDARLSFYGRN